MSYLSTTIEKIRYLISRDDGSHELTLERKNGALVNLDIDTPTARDSAIGTALIGIRDGVPSGLDTLNKLATAIGDDASFSSTVFSSLATRLQSGLNLSDLTNPATARTNLGLGSSATHPATDFDTPAGRDAAISTAITNLLNGVPGALDTLNELATALGDDPNFAATITAALGNRLSWKGTWTAATNYVINDLVLFNGGLYKSPSIFTSGSVFNKANWIELFPQTGTFASVALANVFAAAQNVVVAPNNAATIHAGGGNNGPFHDPSDSAGTLPSPFMSFFSQNAKSDGERVEFAGATPTYPAEYPAFAYAPWQFDVWYGLTAPGQPVVQTTQGGFMYTKYFGPTIDDAAEGWSSVVVMAMSGTNSYNQTKSVTGFEADVLIQNGVTQTAGKIVGFASRAEPQGGGQAHTRVEFYGGQLGGSSTFGKITDKAYSFYEEPVNTALVNVTNCNDVVGVYTPNRIWTNDKLWFGLELHATNITNVVSTTQIDVSTGTASGFTVGQSLRLGWGATEEIMFISSIVGDRITFTAATTKTHQVGEIVADTSQMANLYYQSGGLRTDMGMTVRQTMTAGGFTASNPGSGSPFLAPMQTIDSATPGGTNVVLAPRSTDTRWHTIDSNGKNRIILDLQWTARSGNPYTLTTVDRGVIMDCTSANQGITLPDSLKVNGITWNVYRTDNSANTLTITPVSTTINGAASVTVAGHTWVRISWTGTEWILK